MRSLAVIPVSESQIWDLQKISIQTFLQAFAAENSAADMQTYVEHKFSIEHLQKELSHPESFFYFAQNENDILGYLKLNLGKAQTETRDNAIEIERIYVDESFHGKGIGKLLMEYAIQFAKERGSAKIWLGVWEHNTKAIHFYQKNGFVEFGNHAFFLGEDEQNDLLMELNLEN